MGTMVKMTVRRVRGVSEKRPTSFMFFYRASATPERVRHDYSAKKDRLKKSIRYCPHTFKESLGGDTRCARASVIGLS